MSAQPADKPPSITGINHVKLPCLSIQTTLDFYLNILSFEYLPQYDHFTPDRHIFAKLMQHKGTLYELRYHPEQARAQKGWDPVTFGVATQADLEQWGTWLDSQKVKRSRVFTALKSWILAFEDPDGRIVRLYVEQEEHEWTTHYDQDEYWLGSPVADPTLSA